MRSPALGKVALGCVLLAALPGCMTTGLLRPRAHPPEELRQHSHSLPASSREHVYVYMVNGLTILPHMVGSMNSVAPYVEDLGFHTPTVGTHYSRWRFQNEIRSIHAQDPCARFVLVGYSIGAGVVHAMAETLQDDGVHIDLMVLIDGHSFLHSFRHIPPNVGRVVSINSASPWLRGKCYPGQACYPVKAFFHLELPRRPETLEILGRELIETTAPGSEVR